MATVTHTAAAATLGLADAAMQRVRRNAQFPHPLSDNGGTTGTYTDSDITAFKAKMDAATANGWKVPPSKLSTFDFTVMGASPIGTRGIPGAVAVDPLISEDL